MNGYSEVQIWAIIILLSIGTFLIRFSFLGLIGDRPLPRIVMRLLRYTPVAVLPGLVAPMVMFPQATGGMPDTARLFAAGMTILVGVLTRNAFAAIVAGFGVLYASLALSA